MIVDESLIKNGRKKECSKEQFIGTMKAGMDNKTDALMVLNCLDACQYILGQTNQVSMLRINRGDYKGHREETIFSLRSPRSLRFSDRFQVKIIRVSTFFAI